MLWASQHLRNMAGGGWWVRRWDRSAAMEAELLHNLPVSAFRPGFCDHDLHVLNWQARRYGERCSARISILYDAQVERIARLFALVPEARRCELLWAGPVRPSGGDAKLG